MVEEDDLPATSTRSPPPPLPPAPKGQPAPTAELDQLRQRVASEPWRTRSLGRLNQLAIQESVEHLQAVTDQMLSIFDDSVPYRPHAPFEPDQTGSSDLHELLDSALDNELRELLALLWSAAVRLPEHSRTLELLGVNERHRVGGASGPVARCAEQVSALLALPSCRVYLKPSRHPEMQVAPADPPAIVATTGIGSDPCLRFYVARCVMRARPEQVVLAALPADACERLLGDLRAVGEEGALPESARRLVRGTPAAELARMRQLARSHRDALEREPLRRAAERDEIRGAVLGTADVHLSLQALLQLEPSLRGLKPRLAIQFGEACQRSAAFAEAVRFALSDSYLRLVQHALPCSAR